MRDEIFLGRLGRGYLGVTKRAVLELGHHFFLCAVLASVAGPGLVGQQQLTRAHAHQQPHGTARTLA